MKKTHLYKNDLIRHKSIAAYCGAVVHKDDVTNWTKNIDTVTMP